MPWAALQALVEPHYSKGETGRKLVGLGIMLRVDFLVFSVLGKKVEKCAFYAAF